MTVILVTGSTGHVGEVLTRRVQDGGFDVRVLVRSKDQVHAAEALGRTAVLGDLARPETLAPAVRGVELVLHIAAKGGVDRAAAWAVNVDGTRALAELARDHGVRRFVHISTMSVYGETLPPEVTEETPLAPKDEHPYVATKSEGELVLGEVRAKGLETVILRPGMICNATRSQWGNELVERLRTRGWPTGTASR